MNSFIKTGIVLALLALVTSLLNSLVLSIFYASKGHVFGIIALILTLIIAGVLLFFAFFHNDDSKKRWVFVFTAIFCIVGGIIFISIPTRFHNTKSTLDRAVIYMIPSIGVSSALSICWVYVTGLIIRDILDSAKIDTSQERLLYITANLVQAFLVAFMIACTKQTFDLIEIPNMGVYGQGFVYSIPIWILNAIVFFGLAYFITKNNVEIAADYNSVPEPIPQGNYDNTP
ncbi:hypothetical protein GPJ56_006464 [Histomonas meleagridis]|uniref:uncharacterized protein n=1 Tax=Histomonas meleagridis TaxID=135588 RepID=UPI00355AB22A|nr:hypothetical protein GPJ56_006464 [Histomonas meleagridis]KAH0801410.1 hypothetical protein GO595_006005 [Histomonas meleagridis]